MGCVYVVTCKTTKKQYVGMTRRSAAWRFLGHIEAAMKGSMSKFHRALRRYGIDDFVIEEVFHHTDPKVLRKKEAEWIYNLGTFLYGYNGTRGTRPPRRFVESNADVRAKQMLDRMNRAQKRAKRLKQWPKNKKPR